MLVDNYVFNFCLDIIMIFCYWDVIMSNFMLYIIFVFKYIFIVLGGVWIELKNNNFWYVFDFYKWLLCFFWLICIDYLIMFILL